MEVIPYKKPRKYTVVFDEGTSNQQYVTRYTDTIQGKVFKWVWKKTKNWPGQAQYVRNPQNMEKVGTNTYHYPKGWAPHRYNRKWGYLVEPWGPKITLLTPKYAYRWFIDWYAGKEGRTLIREKNKR